MPKTLKELKNPISSSVKKIMDWLERNVKKDAPYYDSTELAAGVGLGSDTVKNIRRQHPILQTYSVVMPVKTGGVGAIFWYTPEYIHKL